MNVVYAVDTAVVPLADGGMVTVKQGEHWPANDPVVQQQPGLFSADPQHGLRFTVEPAGPVETATAAPGEQRQVRRR